MRSSRLVAVAVVACLAEASSGCGGGKTAADGPISDASREANAVEAETERPDGVAADDRGDVFLDATGDAESGVWGDGGPDGAAAVDAGQAGDAFASVVRWKSGTRLRAMLVKGTDVDVSSIVGIFDMVLGEQCQFTVLEDGGIACVPVGHATAAYADANCTKPVMSIGQGMPPPQGIVLDQPCHVAGALKAGAKIQMPANLFARSGGTCMSEGPAYPYWDYYEAVPVPDAFVTATESRVDRGGGIQARVLASSDGGIFPAGAWDLGRGAPCVPGLADFQERCIPAATVTHIIGINNDFGDPACMTTPLYGAPKCQGTGAPVLVNARTGCRADPPQILSIDEATPFAGMVLYGPACSVRTTTTTQYYSVGAEIPAGTLPSLKMIRDPAGAPSLRPILYETSAGATLEAFTPPEGVSYAAPGVLYDSHLDSACAPSVTSAGLRCLPTERAGTGLDFSDAQCTRPMYIESTSDPACDGTHRPRYIVSLADPGGIYHAHRIGAPFTPEALYSYAGTTGACTKLGVVAAGSTALDTTPIPDTELPALTQMTE